MSQINKLNDRKRETSKLNGVSLRAQHLEQFLAQQPRFSALEVVFENYLYGLGARDTRLIELSQNYAVHLHGVSSNIGSTDPLNMEMFSKLNELRVRTNAFMVSDHLCFTRIDSKSTFELLPIPLTTEMVKHVGERVSKIRDVIKHDFFLENISSYFLYDMNEMDEIEFFNELYKRYDIKILLDVNNLYVNSQNLSYNVKDALDRLSRDAVRAYHVAGHEILDDFLFDTHGSSVQNEVRDIYEYAVNRFGRHPTFLERDENIPEDLELLNEELFSILGTRNEI